MCQSVQSAEAIRRGCNCSDPRDRESGWIRGDIEIVIY